MARPDKATAVAELADRFKSSSATVLTEYRGLSVAQLKELRRSLGEGSTYAVVKNTLTIIAAERAGVDGLAELLVGPSAIAFVKGDAITAAKAIKAFSKKNPLLVIKGGYYEGKVISAAEVQKLADLETREVLLSKVAGVLMATLSKAIRTIDALRLSLETDAAPVAKEDVVEPAAAVAVVEEAAVTEESSVEAPADAEVDAVETAEAPVEETAETPEA